MWQCRFSGIEVPDDLWTWQGFGMDRKYSDNQAEDMARDAEFMKGFDAWVDKFASHVERKGKVEPGKYRAYGYEPPSHRLADVRLWLRDKRMRWGIPRKGSSPDEQRQAGLNRDDKGP